MLLQRRHLVTYLRLISYCQCTGPERRHTCIPYTSSTNCYNEPIPHVLLYELSLSQSQIDMMNE